VIATSSTKWIALFLITLGLCCYLAALLFILLKPNSNDTPTDVSLLESIQQRGYIKCGVANNRYGFSVADINSKASTEAMHESDHNLDLYKTSVGLEADMCRAIAIGLFGSHEGYLYFVSLDGSWDERMTAVTNGTVDILFRGTGLQSEVGLKHNVDMSPVIYFEPIVLLTSNKISSARAPELLNAKICSLAYTFSENAALAYSHELKRNWTVPADFSPEAMQFKSFAQALESLQSNRCDAVSGRLASLQTLMINKKLDDQYHLLALRNIDSIPVIGVTKSDQPAWRDLVSQSIWTPMKAQAQGLTSKNVPIQFNNNYWSVANLDSVNPSVIVQTLGNYAEMYQRHFGRLSIPSGPNNHYLSHPEGRLVAPY